MPNLSHNPITMPDLVDYIQKLRVWGKTAPVILACCISDELPLAACFSACRDAGSIPVVMATFNQVNSDGGYSGMTSPDFVRRAQELAKDNGYDGPVIFGRDHGGPYIIADQKTLPRDEVMGWVTYNITQDLKAGFTCWHADGTSGRDEEKKSGQLPLELVAATTLQMIEHCESERKRLGIGPISYEIGSEEQQGGLTLPENFEKFLKLMEEGVSLKNLASARLDFIVAQTGTHMKLESRGSQNNYQLYQDGFQSDRVNALDRMAQKYRRPMTNLLFTQHYSDHISQQDVHKLLALHIGKANFGPEMTMPELRILLEWENQTRTILSTQNRTVLMSDFRKQMLAELDKMPHIWQEYIPSDQKSMRKKSLYDYDPAIQDAIIIFRGRYVKSRPECAKSEKKLHQNVKELGICNDPKAAIIDEIKTRIMIPRIRQFRMDGLRDQISAKD